MRRGRLVDVHESMQEPDYEFLDCVPERAQPQVVTLEHIRTREALQEQPVRLRGLLDAFGY